MKAQYFVSNRASVDHRFAVTLADNGETGDARTWLNVAPSWDNGGAMLVYQTTNGDPNLVASLDDHNNLTWFNEEEVDGAPMAAVVLEEYGFFPDEDRPDEAIEDFLLDLLVSAGVVK